jgi:hypothetical protein
MRYKWLFEREKVGLKKRVSDIKRGVALCIGGGAVA